MSRTICVVTGTRADYGLLYPLLAEIRSDPGLRLQIIATGMHLSADFGLTYREIESDGFAIDEKVDLRLSSDTPTGIAASIGFGVQGVAAGLDRLRPALLVGLGDRFELLAAVTAAAVSRIPVAHIHGGESSEGAYDELFRHAVTKMSHLHFAAAEMYRRRIIRMGEAPERVFNVGALGIDNILQTRPIAPADLAADLGVSLAGPTFLVTYHPATLESEPPENSFRELLAALEGRPDAMVIFTKPNADLDGRVIGRMVDEFVAAHPRRSAAFTSLGRIRYLSLLRLVDAVIGNSSSGIIEAPAVHTPAINIGDRQQGRARAASVIDCRARRDDITAAIARLDDPDFRRAVAQAANPYGQGGAAAKIKSILKSHDLKDILMKKFYNAEA